MDYKSIGSATIDHKVTSIRKYENGYFTVEVNEAVIFSAESLEDLEKILDEKLIKYGIDDRE